MTPLLVQELTMKLRDWYFESGVFLSEESKKAYFGYQDGLHKVLAMPKKK